MKAVPTIAVSVASSLIAAAVLAAGRMAYRRWNIMRPSSQALVLGGVIVGIDLVLIKLFPDKSRESSSTLQQGLAGFLVAGIVIMLIGFALRGSASDEKPNRDDPAMRPDGGAPK